jgi:hypothetical protein
MFTMTLANVSRFTALAVPYAAPDGRDVVIAVVKASFKVRPDGRAVQADEPAPIRTNDVMHFPFAKESSVRYPSDICVEKRGSDVVILGHAIARKKTRAMDVAVKVRDRSVLLSVHGDRIYYRGIMGVTIGPSAPFERKPIVYERAYGGTSADFSLIERRNPVGRGIAKSLRDLIDTPAPQIEDPAHPITSPRARPAPAGLGALGSHWLPRAGYAGTFDAAWIKARMPLMPLDFDVRHNNVAHPSLQFEEPLAAGERIAILGMHEDGLFQVALPEVRVRMHARFQNGRRATVRPVVDTVLIEPEKRELQLTLRHAFSMGRGSSLLREIRVDEHDEPRLASYSL